MIAVDWGSTNFRASLLDQDGKVIDRISSDDGIKKHRDGRSFEDTLIRHCGDWIEKEGTDCNIFLSGMVGSREGWIETPYVATPASASDLAENLIAVKSEKVPASCQIQIIPGVSHALDRAGDTDVMRGEETEVVGLLSGRAIQDAVVCIPGTHSKWIICRNRKITGFQTWLTGEAFERLTKDSLISGGGGNSEQSVTAEDDAFHRGLDRSRKSGGLLHHLFLGRTDMLMKHVAPESLPSLISGLLIGHEIRDAIQFIDDSSIVQLIGQTSGADAYAKAFEWFGIECNSCKADVHSAGILEISTNQ